MGLNGFGRGRYHPYVVGAGVHAVGSVALRRELFLSSSVVVVDAPLWDIWGLDLAEFRHKSRFSRLQEAFFLSGAAFRLKS